MSAQSRPPLLVRIASTRFGARFFSATLHRLDTLAYRLSGRRLLPTSAVMHLPMLMLTTTGARSGERRTVPLIGLRDGDKIVLIASNWGGEHHPGWYYNLRAHPQANVTVDGETWNVRARQAQGEERERYWQAAVRLYAGYAAYAQRTKARREIPVVVLERTLESDRFG